MDIAPPGGRTLTVLRSVSLALGLLAGLLTLGRVDPAQVAPILVIVALSLSWLAGRAATSVRLPAVLGWLTVGALLGPASSGLVAEVWPAWPYPEGLLGPQAMRVMELPGRLALGLVMIWVGRQLDVRELQGARRAVLGLLAGHLTAAVAVTAAVVSLASAGALSLLGPHFSRAPDDVAGFAVGILGTSAALVGVVAHGARSEGPVTRAVLWVAVIAETAGLAALVAWTARQGVPWTGLLIDDPGSPASFLFDLGVGLTAGGLLAVGTRWAPEARGPWVVGVGAVMTLLAGSGGLSIALVGLVAGLVLEHAAPTETSTALTVATGISGLVLFTMAGAQVPLGALLPVLPLAFVLAAARGLVLFGAAIGIARLLGASPLVVRYGWTGLIASAIPVVGLVTWRPITVETAMGGASLLAAMALIDGLVGATAIHLALGFAGETPRARAEREARPALPVREDGWLDVDKLFTGALRDRLADLADELRSLPRDLSRDLRHGAGGGFLGVSEAYLDDLRREFRRHHRRVAGLVHGAPEDLEDGLHLAQVELADRWRSHVFDHAARMNRHPWKPLDLSVQLDRIVQLAPESLPAPAYAPTEDVARRAFQTFTGWLVGAGPRQDIPYRDVLAFHLSGRVVPRLEGVATLIVNAELHLAARTRELFHRVLDAYETRDGHLLVEADLERVQEDLSDDFRSAREELEAVVGDAEARHAGLLRHAFADLVEDLLRVGTTELPARMRAPARAQKERERGLDVLTRGYKGARDAARVRFAALSLELELVGLELEVQGALWDHGSLLARMVRGRGATQLDRVDEALAEGLGALSTMLGANQTATELADALREEAAEFTRIANDAVSNADELRRQLASDEVLAPLLDALVRAGNLLTDRYEVPDGMPLGGAWRLSDAPRTVEVAFREVVLEHIETSITRDLLALSERYANEVDKAITVIEDLERVVGFNVELARAELLVAGNAPVTREQKEAVREIVLEGVARSRAELHAVSEEAKGWFAEVEQRIRDAVLVDLDDLRVRIADGRFAEIAESRSRTLALDLSAARDADLSGRVRRVTRAWLGDVGIAAWRERLGLVEIQDDAADVTPARFAPPAPRTEVPLVYRRLFSDQALEAGELLGGRHGQADRVRVALAEHSGSRMRTVAVVGPEGVGSPAIVRAALRALRVRGVKRHDLTGPVTPGEVDGWFERGMHGHVHVLSGLHWLYELRPGGFEPLRRFLEGVISDEGRNAWIVDAPDPVWEMARSAVPLDRAFPTVVRIEPLSDAELEEAMLSRHEMSCFDLIFNEEPSGSRSARYRRTWFRDFHAATGGIARDAMRLWLAAIDKVDLDRREVRMGSVPHVPVGAMRALSDKSALALRIAARQGYLDEETWIRLFRDPHLEAKAHLAHLVHWGLLTPVGDRFEVPHHLRRAFIEFAREKEWT